MKFNITLLREVVDSFEECLRPQTQQRQYRRITPEDASINGTPYQVYLLPGQANPPKWKPFVEQYVDVGSLDGLSNTMASLLVLMKVDVGDGEYRYFALSYGRGYNLIEKNVVEPNFGLKTTLNSVDPRKLNSVSTRSIGVQTKHKDEASNLSVEIGMFDFDADTEIVRVVSGACAEAGIGTRISGSDSLQLVTDVPFESLPEKCRSLFERYSRVTYRDHFDFIDYIRHVKETDIIEALEEELLIAVRDKVIGHQIAVAYPDPFKYAECAAFKIHGFTPERTVDDVTLTAVYEHLGNVPPVLENLKQTIRIIGLDDEGEAITSAEPLFAYLVFEADLDGRKYVLTNRKWYEVNRDYLSRVDSDLNARMHMMDTPVLLQWDCQGEDKYNLKYKDLPDYRHLDRQLFSFGPGYGGSRVEIADLFHAPTTKLICVKELNGSATLSHLFAQATVSANLFKDMPEYQQKFNELVDEKWPGRFEEGITPSHFVYAIATERDGDLLELLPVFSRINLLKHLRELTKLGFGVEFAKIRMVATQPEQADDGADLVPA